jgi:putative serine protease PepD
MSDDERPGHETPGDATPWWSRPSGDSWDAPSYATSPTAPTVPVPPDESLRGAENPTQPVPGPAGPPPYSGYAASPWDPPGSPRPPDTLGNDPRPRHGPRAGVLVMLAILIALLAGGTGGAAGYLIAEHQDRSVTVDGANLGAAPARSVERPAGSVAGVAAKVLPSVVQIKVETANGGGTGSGFVVDADGLIVTNNHVVAGATSPSVSVTFADGTTTSARVVGRSASYDLAVVKVNAKNLKPLPLGNSDSVVVGDPVIAIGSPLGLSGTVTSGIVSAKDRRVTAGESSDETAYINAIQTDAAINPGNSGGPLVNLQGEVIGVNSAIATVGGSLTGQGGNIGLGFAIPINQARKTAEQIITTGAAQFPIIGASLDGRYTGDGARIATSSSSGGTPPLVPGGPADKAGLRPGDIIVAIDGKRVQGSSELIVAIRSKSPGDSVTLTVQRGGSERDYRVTLGSSKG